MPDDPEVKVIPAAGVSFADGAEVVRGSALDDTTPEESHPAWRALREANEDAGRLARVLKVLQWWGAGSRCPLCERSHHDGHFETCRIGVAVAAHEARRKGKTP